MLEEFSQIWLVDFEFSAPAGERPNPICLVAHEARSGRAVRIWENELRQMGAPPYPIDNDTLFVAFYASAEISCHLALGWPLPKRVLDLFTEFRATTNGLRVPCGNSLVGALAYHGLDSIGAAEKKEMRDLAIRGGPWTGEERTALLEYCESDVVALESLLPAMAPRIDLPRALLRGAYMVAVAHIEHVGVPIDVERHGLMKEHWEDIKVGLAARLDDGLGVYEGTRFRLTNFERLLASRGYSWPTRESGRLALDDDTFRSMVQLYPDLAPLRDLRCSLSKLRLNELAVGRDGRNRCLLSPYSARTSRNQPSNSRFIFGPAAWLRSLIRPEPDWGLAYIDYGQQEWGIAAALSGDEAMLEAYSSGDPYLQFAVQAGAAPPDATKDSHNLVRSLFKACALAVQYGMGQLSLALRIGQSEAHAKRLLELHRQTYPRFWKWSDAAVDSAMLTNRINTTFGWCLHVGPDPNPRSLRNFPMQGNGAEMLRIACILATRAEIRVCAPVHDALLVEAPLSTLDQVVAETQQVMAEASRIVLDGFELRTDVEVVKYPYRYRDKRGKKMWTTVRDLISERAKA